MTNSPVPLIDLTTLVPYLGLVCETANCPSGPGLQPLAHFPPINAEHYSGRQDRLGYNGWCRLCVEEYQAAAQKVGPTR